MVSMAFCISWMETHSFLLWKLWPPVKRLGVGNPMNDRRAPSVPPRIRLFFGLSPARLIASSRRKPKPVAEFAFYGPTCDSSDYLPGPFVLPACVREGDYIEIGQIGAYGRVLANRFNGFGEYDEVILTDEPMLSMYTSAEEPSLVTLKTARA